MENESQNQIHLSNFQLGVIWFIFILIVVDWLPFFLTVLLHFYSIRRLDVGTAILILAYFLAPIMVFFLTKIAEKSGKTFTKYLLWLLPLLIAIVGGLMITWYFIYYQLGEPLQTEFDGFASVTPIVGNLSTANPSLVWLFLTINGIICLGILPILFILIGGGRGIVQFSHAMSRGLTCAALYFLLRFGGFPGTMLRLGFVFLVIAQLCIVGVINQKGCEEVKLWARPNLPYHETLMALVGFAFALAVANLGTHGLLFQSWMWIAVLVGSLLVEIPGVSQKIAESQMLCKSVIWIFISLLMLILAAQFTSLLLRIQPLIVSFGLFLSLFYVKASLSLYKSSDQQKKPGWNEHPLRHLMLNFWFLLGFLMPLLATLVDPLTEIIVFTFGVIEFFLIWRSQRRISIQKGNSNSTE